MNLKSVKNLAELAGSQLWIMKNILFVMLQAKESLETKSAIAMLMMIYENSFIY